MRHTRLGPSGLQVSALGLGTRLWGSGVEEDIARDLMTAFVEGGGTLIDTSPGFGHGAAESWVGSFVGSVAARQDLVLTTKAGLRRKGDSVVPDASRSSLLRSLDDSLRRLRTDYVDLFIAEVWDPQVPLEETLETLEYAVRSGKARYIGVGMYAGWQLARAATLQEARRLPLVAIQSEYSLVDRLAEVDVLPAAVHLGVGVIAWGALGRGALTGSYRGAPSGRRGLPARYVDPHAQGVTDAVITAARGMQVTPAEVALAWVHATTGVDAVVVGARSVAQVRAAVAGIALVLPEQIRSALTDVSE